MHRVEDLSADGAVAVDAERDGRRQRCGGRRHVFPVRPLIGEEQDDRTAPLLQFGGLGGDVLQRMIGGFLPDADQSDHEIAASRGEQHRGLPAGPGVGEFRFGVETADHADRFRVVAHR